MVISGKIRKLQRRIVQSNQELSEIKKLEQPMPELIYTTNVLRSNEYLAKENKKQSQLLAIYEDYAKELENLVSKISMIKTNLKVLRKLTKSRKKLKKKLKNRRTIIKKKKFSRRKIAKKRKRFQAKTKRKRR